MDGEGAPGEVIALDPERLIRRATRTIIAVASMSETLANSGNPVADKVSRIMCGEINSALEALSEEEQELVWQEASEVLDTELGV